MTGHIGVSTARQFTHLFPHLPQARHIQQPDAAPETGLHPLIVSSERTSATRALEPLAGSRNQAHFGDELSQILGKLLRVAWIAIGGDGTGQPSLHHPRQSIIRPGSADHYQRRCWKSSLPKQFRRSIGLGLHLLQHRVRIFTLQRKARRKLLTDTKNRVDCSSARHTRLADPATEATGHRSKPARLTR